MVKAVNVLNFFSALLFLATLLFVYAFLPVMVNINPEKYGWSIHKESFFYGLLVVSVVLGLFVFILSRRLAPIIKSASVSAWLKGLAFVLFSYLSFLIGYVGVVNNPQHFNPGSYGYLNYLGPLLVVVWIVGLIFFLTKKNKTI